MKFQMLAMFKFSIMLTVKLFLKGQRGLKIAQLYWVYNTYYVKAEPSELKSLAIIPMLIIEIHYVTQNQYQINYLVIKLSIAYSFKKYHFCMLSDNKSEFS